MSNIGNKISKIFNRGQGALRGVFGKKERTSRANGSLAMHQVMRARKTRKVPSASQIKFFPRLLTNTEKRLAIFAVLAIIISGSLLVWQLLDSQRTDQPAVGGEYTEGMVGTPQLINPLYALTSDVDADLSRLIYSGLMRYDIKKGLVLDLAESYEVNEDHTVYTFTLREDAKWHDGRAIRASDIVFTISAIQNPEYRSPLEVSFSGIAIEQVDERR
ncbi:MAG: ABC transporter substrate-binding protein, partial [Patescibacteria group bacterium]